VVGLGTAAKFRVNLRFGFTTEEKGKKKVGEVLAHRTANFFMSQN
jgi:hypothetical protein